MIVGSWLVKSTRPRALIRLVLSVILLVVNTSGAFALQYGVSGKENQSSGTTIRWTGGHGYNRVAWPSPYTPRIDYSHVNSMYMRRDDLGHFYEVGWTWDRNADGTKWAKPKWFYVIRKNGIIGKPVYSNNIWGGGQATPGTDHLLSIHVDTYEAGAPARMKVDNTVVYNSILVSGASGLFADGVITWGSERQTSTEDNHAWFWHLMKRRHDFVWELWGDHQLWLDNDPGYHLHFTSNYEGLSHTPNQWP